MTDRRGDPGFSVAPRRLGDEPAGPGRRRARRIGLVVVIVASAAILAIGWLGPRLSDRPAFDLSFFATPVPSRTASPSPNPTLSAFQPIPATPLPSITRPDGPSASGRIAFMTSTFGIADLATGDVLPGPPLQLGQDAVFAAADSGWTCVCFGVGADPHGQTVLVRIVGIGPTGSQTSETDVATLAAKVVNPDAGSPLTTDVDADADGRHALLATATQVDASTWRIALAPIDLTHRRIGSTIPVGLATAPPGPSPSAAPGPSPAPGDPSLVNYLDGPHVRIAPDRRVAFVWAAAQRSSNDGAPQASMFAWRVALGPDGSVESIAEAPALRDLPIFCGQMAFATADRLAWLCPDITDPSADFNGHWQFGSVDLAGKPQGTTEVDLSTNGYFGEPLFDRANGMVYAWDATGLTMVRIDVRTLATTRTTFDRLARSADGVGVGGGSAPVDWHDTDSAVQQFGYGQLSGDPDGSRIYAIGYDAQTAPGANGPATLGVFVIDRTTLALVDRWAPDAAYQAIGALPGGLVALGGMPGSTPDGLMAPWEASLTVYEAATGRIVVRFGRLGNDNVPLVLGP